MKKLNNKGFTLIEVLAVIVILGVLATITVPTVSNVIKQNEENSYKNLQKSIIAAAKIYISDNKYNITLSDTCDSSNERNIITIKEDNSSSDSEKEITVTDSKIPIKLLVESGDLNDGNINIVNPRNKNLKLVLYNDNINKEESYILVKFDCSSKKFKYPEKGNDGNYFESDIKLNWK